MSRANTSPSEFFRRLGAPLVNVVWSWGAVRGSDGVVFLRVWQDRERKVDGKWYTMLAHHEVFVEDPTNLGWQERLAHVARIREGAPCYLVMCEAKDVNASPRASKSFNDRDVFVGGALVDMDGDWWIERTGRVAARELMPSG
jgi:hypothetical protein